MKNAKAKGSRNERKTMDMLMTMGYDVCKSGGSLGLWDVVGLKAGGPPIAVQTKSNHMPVKEEMHRLRQAAKQYGGWVCCQVHVWKDRQPLPEIVDL